MKKEVWFLAVLILGLLNTPILAAAEENANPTTGTVIQQTVENRDYLRLEKELQQKKAEESKVTDKTDQSEPTTPESTAQFVVKKIVTNQSEILSNEEIAAIIGKYEGRSVDIKTLYQALKEINDLYAQKGYITARAILPPQKIENGVVRFQLVEAHFGQFVLEGNLHTDRSYIFKRFSQKNGDLVDIKKLEQDIFYFNRTNDVQLKAELKPGKEFGFTDCVLKVTEPDNIQGTLFSDNEGSKTTGEYRLGFSWVDNSLTGHRDFLAFSPLWSEGTWAGSLSYNWPLTKKGTRLGITYSDNQSAVISGNFESLNITSNESDIGLNLSHPFIVKPNFKFDGFASLYNKKADTEFGGETLAPSNEINTYSLGLSFQSMDTAGFWYSRYEITAGDSDDPGDFLRFNFAAVRQQKLKNDQLLIYRLSGQYSGDDKLPSTESFSLGGINTVRGYTAGTLSGDRGYNLSVEYNFPLWFSKQWKGFCFIDHGGTFPYKGDDEGIDDRDYLTSIGLGANFYYSKYFSGKILAGYGFNPPEDKGGFKIEFYLQSVLF